jgi:hypothetical protein
MPDRTLTNRDIVASAGALAALDASDDKGKPLYKFGGAVRLAIAKKLKRLQVLRQELADTEVKLARQFDVLGDGKDDRAATKAFKAEQDALLSQSQTFDMASLKVADLKLSDNEIPSGLLAALEWLLEE